MLLIAGLGNPGQKYQDNRHNVGFMAVDAIAHRHNFLSFSQKFNALCAEKTIDGVKAILLKPLSYMNLSGGPIGEAMRFYKIEPENLIVIHDELDIAVGKIRMKRGGGHGGHNGLKSIDAHLGPDYRRIRIGIGHPGDKDMVSHYVLHDFGKDEEKMITPVLDAIADTIGMAVAGDDNGFVTKVALLTQPPKPPKEIKPTNEEKDGI